MKKLFAKILVKCLTPFYKGIMPVVAWASRTLELGGHYQPHPIETGSYVESVGYINPAVLMAAKRDQVVACEENAEHYQATLNACMESFRADQIINPLIAMMGSLIGKYDQKEMMARVFANVLCTGMFVERRLSKTGEQR